MKIQIVNMLPLEYPYQVTKMQKQMKEGMLAYDIEGNDIHFNCDLYILIIDKDFDKAEQWILNNRIKKEKVVIFTCEHTKQWHCWCMPKAFEKEFDAEKMMQFLGCIIMDNPNAELLCSYDLKSHKVPKEPLLMKCIQRIIKNQALKQDVILHCFVKEKNRKLLDEKDKSENVHQHWIRGVSSEVEILVCKQDSNK